MEPPAARIVKDAVPSSSPAFATPRHPINQTRAIVQPAFIPSIPTILSVQLPPASLRPLAFRTFTKKHNLTLGSSALQALATFVGKHCGSAWREEGTAEKVLEEVAKAWKKSGGAVIVDDGHLLKSTLKMLESCMSGGRVVQGKIGLKRQMTTSFSFNSGDDASVPSDDPVVPNPPPLLHHTSSFGMSGLDVGGDQDAQDEDNESSQDARSWLKVVDAHTQPRLIYNTHKKHFERLTTKPTLLPPPDRKTTLFRDRYHIIHQRVLRNPAFQAPSFNTHTLKRQDSVAQRQNFRITPVANLLGRSGSTHLILGLLVVTPTGSLALHDLTGGITLDLDYARGLQDGPDEEAPWVFPGCIVLVEGVYQEEFSGAGSSGLGGGGGVGGIIGGKFVGITIGNPPCERRSTTLGLTAELAAQNAEDAAVGAGFGWTDFLGVGSDKATGTRMRRLEERLLSRSAASTTATKIIILGEVNLNDPDCAEALREVLKQYASEELDSSPPLSFILTGDFISQPAMARGGTGSGSIEYKECLDGLASILAEFPSLLVKSKWIFVPGDNDPWPSAFSAGASATIPRNAVPALFTSRIRRVFANVKDGPASTSITSSGEAIWTTNPSRLTLFGSAHEIVIFRDDLTGRMRRSAINYGKLARDEEADADRREERNDHDTNMSGGLDPSGSEAARNLVATETDSAPDVDHAMSTGRKLILSLLPQSHLSPFPLSTRPIHWDLGSSALSLYPLPHTLVLADPHAPAFAITYEGCHVMNPGRLCDKLGKRRKVGWIEYDALTKRGILKSLSI